MEDLRNFSVQRRMAGRLMNGALGLAVSSPGLSRHFYVRTQKNQETSLRVAGVPSEIRTQHLPNTSLWPYVYSNCLVNTTYMKWSVKCTESDVSKARRNVSPSLIS